MPGRAGGEAGAEALLARLTAAGVLTAAQAQRAKQELSTLLGQQIPGYQLMEKLGQGAMGVVYKARQVSMDRLVAVKVLHPQLAADPEFLQRLTREAHVAAKLSHNNIVQAIDVGSAGPLHYFVMELVEGKTIRQELDAGKVYGEREALEIVLQIAQALEHAAPARPDPSRREAGQHRADGRRHRQAGRPGHGPRRGRPDAGRARAQGWPSARRTTSRRSRSRGRENIDVRADIYSLGATLYHMVDGPAAVPGQGGGAAAGGPPDGGADAAGPPQPTIVVGTGRGGRVHDGEGPPEALRHARTT